MSVLKNLRIVEFHRGYRYSAELTANQRQFSDIMRNKPLSGNEIAGRFIGQAIVLLTSSLKDKK